MENKELKNILENMSKLHFKANKDYLNFNLENAKASEEIIKIVNNSHDTLLKNILAIIDANIK